MNKKSISLNCTGFLSAFERVDLPRTQFSDSYRRIDDHVLAYHMAHTTKLLLALIYYLCYSRVLHFRQVLRSHRRLLIQGILLNDIEYKGFALRTWKHFREPE